MSHELEKDWTYRDYRCAITRINQTYARHRCAYVGLPKGHPLHGKTYSTAPRVLRAFWNKHKEDAIGKRGSIPLFFYAAKGKHVMPSMDLLFDVHGSLTYSSKRKDYPVESDGSIWWLGFDAGHCDDNPDVQDTAYMIRECESLVDQIIEALELAEKKADNGNA